jgi:hypothetical protein
MLNSHTNIPRQRIPDSKKTEEWKKETMDAIISLSNFSPVKGSYRWHLRQAYRFYNGIIDDADYTHVLRPYGNTRKNWPAKLHNYPIIKPIVDLLLGEKIKRPLNYSIVVENDDVTNKKAQAKQEAIFQAAMDQYLFELQQQGIDIGQNMEEAPPELKEVEEAFERSYRDNRAQLGEKALNFIRRNEEIDDKIIDGFKHFLVAGQVFSSRKIVSNEVKYDILNPLHVDYDKSLETKFIEDGDWALVRRLLTPSDIIDEFYDVLSVSEVDQVENPKRDRTGEYLVYSDDLYQEGVASDKETARLVEVIEVYWKSRKKIGFVSYVDEYGEVQEFEVDSDYKVQEDEEVEWYWINEVWKGFRIDGDIYVDVEPVPVQRGSMDNPSKCKLPINGRRYSDMNAGNISLVMMGMPFQITYNIYKYRLETAIARSKDILAQIDINILPDEYDIDEWMDLIESTGIAFTQYKENNAINPQHQAVLDLSIKTIQDYIALLESIKYEWESLAGVSKQRQGEVSQYETKGGAEYSILQSSTITEDYFNKFRHFEERDLKALLDYSRYAWINGKKAHYLTPEYTEDFLEIDGLEYSETEYGVFISTSQKDIQALNNLKQLSQSMMQNGASMTDIIEIMDANSISKIKEKISKAEQSRAEMEAQAFEMEQQAAKEERELEFAKLDIDRENNIRDNETKLQVQEMKNNADLQAKDVEITEKQRDRRSQEELKEKEIEAKKEIEQKKARAKTNSTN